MNEDSEPVNQPSEGSAVDDDGLHPCVVCGVQRVAEDGPDLDFYTDDLPPEGAACMEAGCGLYLQTDGNNTPFWIVAWDEVAGEWLPVDDDPEAVSPDKRHPLWAMSWEECEEFRRQHPA